MQTALHVARAATITCACAVPAAADIGFMDATSFPGGSGPTALSVGDVDADGDIDLAIVNPGPKRVSIVPNLGGGAFASPSTLSFLYPPAAVTLADLDGDGDPDMVVGLSVPAGEPIPGRLDVLLNQGSGQFAPASFHVVSAAPAELIVADLNGDAMPDIISAGQGGFSVLFAIGGGAFHLGPVVDTAWPITGARVGDLDADGDLDLATSHSGSGRASVYRNNGNGLFARPISYNVQGQPADISLADLDGDAAIDMVVSTGPSGGLSVLRNAGDASFFPPISIPIAGGAGELSAGDIDADGRPDLAVASPGLARIAVVQNVEGSLAVAELLDPGASPLDVKLADVDADGDLDIISVGSAQLGLSVLLNTTPPACLPDLDGDGVVGSGDLNRLLGAFGAGSAGDADADGDTDSDDLNVLLGAFGTACP